MQRKESRELQEIVYLLEYHRAQLNVLERRLELLSTSYTESLRAKQTLIGYEKLSPETQVLMPIGSDTFVYAKVVGQKKALTNVGGDVVIEDNILEIAEKIDKKLKEIEDLRSKMIAQARKLQAEITRLTRRAQELLA
jgi:prefoldin alpha subunit